MKVYVQECGGNPDNRSTEIDIPNNDFKLVVGYGSYRFHIEENGNLVLALINRKDYKITTENGYPAVKLIDRLCY